ncbi:exosome complex component RRP43 [Cryptosporidium felis]|nr:exosome complex component RRP43 [Cryptosporidium felis]
MNKSSLWYLRPDEYLNRFIEQGIRCDGRKPNVCRNFEVELNELSSSYSGAISVRIGNSSYIACSDPQIIRTCFDQKSNESITNNRINVSLELPAICGYSGNQNYSNFISSSIIECLNDKRIINKDAFVTKFGNKELHWLINIKVVCLSYDGNSFDYALIATLASLYRVSLPENLIWDNDAKWFRIDSTSSSMSNRNSNRTLNESNFFLKKIPVFISFSYLNNKLWVCDPNHKEDSQGNTVTFCCIDDEIKSLQTQCINKYSPGKLKSDIDQLIKVASKRAEEIREVLLNK